MKSNYFCPNCGSELQQGDYNYNYEYATLDFECPYCGWEGNENGIRIEMDGTIYAADIEWDVDDEDVTELGLPSQVKIPPHVEEDDIADYLSDEYGFCVLGFDVEQK